jgi:hypothetical protein
MQLLRSRSFRALLAVALCSVAAAAQEGPRLPRANEVVEPRVSTPRRPVRPGRAFELAVVARIRPGFHINANPPSTDYLIPTKVEADLPPELHVLETKYPRGVLRHFKFSQEKLSVYEGTAPVRLKIAVAPNAAPGPRKIPLTLYYQACNEEACLPPVKLPLTAAFTVGSAISSRGE